MIISSVKGSRSLNSKKTVIYVIYIVSYTHASFFAQSLVHGDESTIEALSDISVDVFVILLYTNGLFLTYFSLKFKVHIQNNTFILRKKVENLCPIKKACKIVVSNEICLMYVT